MGNYVYKIKPSNSITVEGLGETLTVHCAEYAYKPYGCFSTQWDYSKRRYVDGSELNRKMSFKSGVQGCINAWKRRGDRPEYVTYESAESIKKNCSGLNTGYGSGAPVYLYDKRHAAGHFNDGHEVGWLVGWIYWFPDVFNEDDGEFVLQYRQLDALEEDPRREAAA